MRTAHTATDANGRTLRVGDTVQTFSPYDGSPMNIGRIVAMHRQGYDGTILQLDVPPSPEYPHHFTHRATRTTKLETR